MVWTLCSILSTVKEMCHAVDKKLNPFHTRRWEGWLLPYIQQNIFQYNTCYMDRQSPFAKKVNTIEGIVKKVNCAAPVSPNADDDPGSAYQMLFDFMSSLFPEDD